MCEMVWAVRVAGGVARRLDLADDAFSVVAATDYSVSHRAGTVGGRVHALRRLGHGLPRLGGDRARSAAPRQARLTRLLVCQHHRGRIAGGVVLPTTPWCSATGSTSCAGPTPPRPSNCAPPPLATDRRIPAGTITWVSLKFFVKAAEMDAAGRSVGEHGCSAAICTGNGWAWLIARAAGILRGPCCCGFRVPSTPIQSPTGRCPSSSRPGGRTPGTTRAMGWKCFRSSRWGSAFFTHCIITGLARISYREANATLLAAMFALIDRNQRGPRDSRAPTGLCGRHQEPRSRAATTTSRSPLFCAHLAAQRPGAPVLMNTSVHPEFVAFSGIPLRQTINESDREYLQAALAAPARARGGRAGVRGR